MMQHGEVNVPVEIPLRAASLPAAEAWTLEVDVEVCGPDGESRRVPAFWSGDRDFRARFAAPGPGRYTWRSRCEEPKAGLSGQEGEIEIAPYEGSRTLYRRGRLRAAASGRSLAHADGTPFFWLGDTWWMGLCKRWSWPEDFQSMTADRAAKGFSVVQIVAGLYPDMPAFDERGANEAGFPWEPDYARINPAYFDMADLRIQWLVRAGLVPCIVGCWGYFLPWMGLEKMKRHWRYLVARWSAYPVVWCLAGEVVMPYYLSETKENDRDAQKRGWTELTRYVKEIDPHGSLVTVHPAGPWRDQLEDNSLVDFTMLHTGHGGPDSVADTISQTVQAYGQTPPKPVLDGEVNYEGILHGNGDEIQRMVFWSCVLSGACGHTYGANGIWQINRPDKPFGPSPWGGTWGNTPWQDAARLVGSGQLGLGAALLRRYPWWRFEPHPDWVSPAAGPENYFGLYAAGIPGEIRLIYLYNGTTPFDPTPARVLGLEPGVRYRATFVDPRNGTEHPLGKVKRDQDGAWPIPLQPELKDWLLLLKRG